MVDLLKGVSLNGFQKRYPHQISVGEARRVALARALAPNPRNLLMDEPVVNLDSELKLKILQYQAFSYLLLQTFYISIIYCIVSHSSL